MIKIYDFSNNELSYKNGSYGGAAGSKDGIVINGEEWMIKYPKSLSQMEGENASYSTAPLSEFLGSHIYSILGYDVHDTMLGIRNNKLVVACKDFATDRKMLLEIRTIKNHVNSELFDIAEKRGLGSSETHIVDLNELMLHLDKNPILANIEGIKQRFFEQAIIDVFINNNDRNNGNWGIIREKGKNDRLAPIFDNGGSFSTKMSEKKILKMTYSHEIKNNVLNVLTAYGENEHKFNAKKFFSKVEGDACFQNAIVRVTENIKAHMDDILSLLDSIPEHVEDKNKRVYEVCSGIRKNFYKYQLKTRFENLLMPECEKVKRHNHSENHLGYMDEFDVSDGSDELNDIDVPANNEPDDLDDENLDI